MHVQLSGVLDGYGVGSYNMRVSSVVGFDRSRVHLPVSEDSNMYDYHSLPWGEL